MLIKRTEPRSQLAPALALAVVAVAFGGAVGWFARAPSVAEPASKPRPELRYYGGSRKSARDANEAPPSAALPAFALRIDAPQLETLLAAREAALARRVLSDAQQDVPAFLDADGRTLGAHVRLKGDLVDHLDTDQWSMRIELDGGEWRGMRVFAIQHPKTRGLSSEWLVFEVARRNGLLAPRCGYVDVELNGERKGIYIFEEQPGHEMLAACGRDDGPIVRFDEDVLWSARLDRHGAGPSATNARAFGPAAAEIDAIGARRDGREGVQDAVAKLGKLRALRGATSVATIDDTLDVENTARLHALITFFGCSHALYWPNLRFHLDPRTGRLEPLCYDVGNRGGELDPYAIAGAPYRDFLASPRYARALFEELARCTRADFVDELQAELGDEYERLARTLSERGYAGAVRHSGGVLWDELRARQVEIGELIRPADPVSWACTFEAGDDAPAALAIDAWCTTRVPVVIEGFELHGVAHDARACADANSRSELAIDRSAVLLPGDGRVLHFELRPSRSGKATAIDELTALRTPDGDRDARLKVHARYRVVGDARERDEQLVAHSVDPALRLERQRFAPPSLEQALAAHACLAYDAEDDRLYVRSGTWQVEGDLALPEGRSCAIEPGAELRFEPDAALLASGALLCEGDGEHPIVLGPQDAQRGWAGIVVLDARETSSWHDVAVYGTRALERGEGRTSAGVTFQRSPAELRSCRFEDARGASALGAVASTIALEDCSFARCAHGGFDGEFAHATLVRCRFEELGGDALALRGSRARLEACEIEQVGRTGVSAREASRVTLRSCSVKRAAVGVASADGSLVDADGLVFARTTSCALVAAIREGGYGPATLNAAHVAFQRCEGHETWAGARCELTIDGRAVAAEEGDAPDF